MPRIHNACIVWILHDGMRTLHGPWLYSGHAVDEYKSKCISNHPTQKHYPWMQSVLSRCEINTGAYLWQELQGYVYSITSSTPSRYTPMFIDCYTTSWWFTVCVCVQGMEDIDTSHGGGVLLTVRTDSQFP